MAKSVVTNQLSRYASIGILGTLVHYAVFICGDVYFGYPLAFSSLGFMLGAVTNHHLNRRYTFNSDKPYFRTFVEFFAVAGVMFLVNFFSMYMLIYRAQLPEILSQVITTFFVFFIGFFINKKVVFLTSTE